MNALKSLSAAKAAQNSTQEAFHGVDCGGKGITSMK
jgi:hypothetical protein